MPSGVDLGIDGEDVSIGTDDVAHALGIAGVPGLAGAVSEPDFPRGVAEQGEVEVELLGERAVLVLSIEADS
jgi:hypothetical protein